MDEIQIQAIEGMLGKYKKVVRATTGEAFRVPMRDIITQGVREQDLDRYPRWEEPTSYTCPRCGMTSYNEHDISNRYCANCHDWEIDLPNGMTVQINDLSRRIDKFQKMHYLVFDAMAMALDEIRKERNEQDVPG